MRPRITHILAIVALSSAWSVSSAQTLCDSIVIEHIRYSAIDQQQVEVSAYSEAGDCVGYPSFVLFDQNGDTLASETVWYFCIGLFSAQSHFLAVRPGAQIPSGPFNGRLELFSGFGDTLVCSWDLDGIELCPAATCTQAEIYLTNTGMLVEFTAYWWVVNDAGQQMAVGTIEMDTLVHTRFDTICLPPGHYELGFSPFSPIDDSYVIGVTPSYNQTIGTNTAIDQGTSPWDLSFSWYAACIDGTNSIAERGTPELTIWMEGNNLRIDDPMGHALGSVDVYTATGVLARSLRELGDAAIVNLNGLAANLHIVRITRPNGTAHTRTILVP